MKIKHLKAEGAFAEKESVGKVHLAGPISSTACGLANEDYDSEETGQPLTCTTCITYLNWAKKISKIKS